MEKQISLYFNHGTSDKEYHVQLQRENDLYLVNFQYGRRGKKLSTGCKTKDAVTWDKANKIYEKLIKNKVSKGYTEGTSGQPFSSQVTAEHSGMIPQLLNELKTQTELLKFIDDDQFYAQEKYDGERRIAQKNATTTIGINKKGLIVSLHKEIANSLLDLCIVDAEQVGDHLYVFDVRSRNDITVENEAYEKRLAILSDLSFGPNISVINTATTKEEKQALLTDLQATHKEGIIFKRKDHQYKEGRPHSGGDVFKYKFYKTATVQVSAHTVGKRSVQMSMQSNDQKRVVGKVTIPSNKEIPKVGSFIEVRYLYAYQGGALYQPTYLGERSDQDDTDINDDQLIFKSVSQHK